MRGWAVMRRLPAPLCSASFLVVHSVVGKGAHGDGLGDLAKGGLHHDRILEAEERELVGADARGLALALELETAQYHVGGDRHLVEAHADGMVDRIRDRGNYG